MNVKEIKELVDIVARRGLSVLEVERAGFRLRIEGPRGDSGPLFRPGASRSVVEMLPADLGVPPALAAPIAHLPAVEAGQRTPAGGTTSLEEGLHLVTSPIVGTFYRAASPEADPFVKVGDGVEKGQTLCIVEAMKLMNEIESDVAGTVVEVFPQNGQPVEYGERLFTIRLR